MSHYLFRVTGEIGFAGPFVTLEEAREYADTGDGRLSYRLLTENTEDWP